MRQFFARLFLFLGILLVCMVVSDYFYSLVCRDVRTANMEIWKDVMEGKASADLLFCGDSRANTDCYPPVIDSITGHKSYSIGIIGHHFRIGRLRYDMYRRYNDKPLVVAHFVDNWTFSRENKFEQYQFLPWMWNVAFAKDALHLAPLYFLGKSVPWYRYHSFLLSDKDWSIRASHEGFFTYDLESYSCFPEDRYVFKENPVMENVFRSFISGIRREGIKVVLVLPPLCGSASFYGEAVRQTKDCFKAIAKECGVPVLDYLQVPVFEDSTLFIDSVHLNKKGAKVFSDSLAHDIMRLGLFNND